MVYVRNCHFGWDPHSVLGNGNTSDRSLDGMFGRISMIGRLGWGNKQVFIEYKKMVKSLIFIWNLVHVQIFH